jgi:hypothetical protein
MALFFFFFLSKIPEQPVEPAFFKPVLFVMLPELISQTHKSRGNFSVGVYRGLVKGDG